MRYLHTTLHVSDLEAAEAFFADWAGLRVLRRMSAGGHTIVFLANGEGETAVELLQAPQGGAYSGSGLSLGFASKNLEADFARAQAEGLALGPIVQPTPHTRFFFLSGPDNLTVQLVENC